MAEWHERAADRGVVSVVAFNLGFDPPGGDLTERHVARGRAAVWGHRL